MAYFDYLFGNWTAVDWTFLGSLAVLVLAFVRLGDAFAEAYDVDSSIKPGSTADKRLNGQGHGYGSKE